MPFSPATSRLKIDDMATTSLRVGRLARWPFPISRGQPAKLQGRLDHGLRAPRCLPELRAGGFSPWSFHPVSV